MNEYRARCIALALDAGLRIGYLADGKTCREALDALVAGGYAPDGSVVRRASGAQSVTAPNGGCIRFYLSATSMRGAAADVVYIVGDKIGPNVIADVAPALMLSDVGELVRC